MSNDALQILIRYQDQTLPRIQKIDQGDWVDLYTGTAVSLQPFQDYQIPLNVAMELPEGYEAILTLRSSAYKCWGVLMVNSPSVIDNHYKGNDDIWHCHVMAMREVDIPKGTRICQFRIQETMCSNRDIEFQEVETLHNPNRGGFGTTNETTKHVNL